MTNHFKTSFNSIQSMFSKKWTIPVLFSKSEHVKIVVFHFTDKQVVEIVPRVLQIERLGPGTIHSHKQEILKTFFKYFPDMIPMIYKVKKVPGYQYEHEQYGTLTLRG